jgi:hypothetical protein
VNQDWKQRESQLREDIYGAIDEVGGALESGEHPRQIAAGKLVEPLVTRYHELVAAIGEGSPERERIERTLGRLLTDLRRSAGQLSQRQDGQKAQRAADAGGQPFILTRAPSPFLTRTVAPPPRRRTSESALAVGGELEAWCGKCKESRTHRIVVIHEGKPYRVQCVHCRSQHGYRSDGSSRAASDGPSTPSRTSARASVAIDPEAQKRRLERERLAAELAAATEVRPFDPAAMYKSGQLIEHPKYGRGRIESITRGSLLVRFLDGLRPLSRAT